MLDKLDVECSLYGYYGNRSNSYCYISKLVNDTDAGYSICNGCKGNIEENIVYTCKFNRVSVK